MSNETSAPPAASQGQEALDQLTAQSRELVHLHRLLVKIHAGIVATPAPSANIVSAQTSAQTGRSISFFAGLDLLARKNATAIRAIKSDLEDLARIFAIDLADEIQQHQEEADAGTIGG